MYGARQLGRPLSRAAGLSMQDANLPRGTQSILEAFVAWARDRHVVTYADLNRTLPAREFSSQEIEAILHYLAEHGVLIEEDAV